MKKTFMAEIAKLICIYLLLYILGTFLFIISFHTPLLANLDVFFYRGLGLILFWGIILAVLMAALRHFHFRNLLTIRDILLLFTAYCCVNVVLFTHLPVTADRSVTVFMLGYMADHAEESFTEEEMESYFIGRYVHDYRAFAKRFHEQEEIHTIERSGDGYKITEEGIALMKVYEAIAACFNLDTALIHSSP